MKISHGWYWILAATVFLFLILLNVVRVQDKAALAFGYAGPVPMFALDEMPLGYTPAKLFQVMTAYGENGRQAYQFLLLTVDFVFPLLYGSFLFLSIRAVARKVAIPAPFDTLVSSVGLIATFCDWLENASFVILLRTYPRQSLAVANSASWFTEAKFFASGLSVVILACLWLYGLLRTRASA